VAVTIREVAKQAGVSVATVSRVMNNSGPVRAETRERVERVAEALQYTPHSGAQGLIMRRTRNLGVILPDLYGEFFSEVIRGMDQATQRAGYNLLVSSSHDDRAEIDAAVRAMRGRVDGLVLMTPDTGVDGVAEVIRPALPVVLMNTAASSAGVHTINVDNFGGSYAMVRHLVSGGHVRVGLIGGDPENHDARERRRGYEAALRDAGLEVRPEWQVESDFRKGGGWAAARVLMGGGGARPTAIFAANDAMAVGALSSLQEMGLAVPDDVAVAGFDDIPLARYLRPPLSSVHVDNSGLGARAVELLLESVEGGWTDPIHEILPTTLVIRRSCGVPLPASGIEGAGTGA
jgi:LacI family transcriptional regulator